MAFKDKINRSRAKFTEQMNILFNRGPKLDEDFWDDLEETLILSDLGAQATMEVIDRLRDQATRKALPDAYAVLDLLAEEISGLFAEADPDPFRMNPVCILFVGINGAGKTTTVGKIANQASIGGRNVLIGSADTFRAAAIEQLDIWGERSGVEVVKRERGADPASVCFDVVSRAEELKSDLVLIDTSGRLHTSDDLMRELQKIVNVTRKHADVDVKTVLVLDATTGQNGLAQAREFDKALDLDGVIMTKLDGTAKGGIAVAVSHELGLPILRVGVGEGIEDLQPFDPLEYAEALFGDMREGRGLERREDSDYEADYAVAPEPDDWSDFAAEPSNAEPDETEDVNEVEEVEENEEIETAEEAEAVDESEDGVVIEETDEIEDDATIDESDDEDYDDEDGIEIWLEVDDDEDSDEEASDEEASDETDEAGDDDEEEGVFISLEAEKETFREKMRRWFS